MPDRIAGRTALVTGGGSGLGPVIARHLLDAGARVLLVGRTRATLESTAELLGEHAAVRALVADVSSPASVAGLRRATEEDEEVSILINNAGIAGPVAPLVDIEPEEWDEVFATNVRGTFLMCRAFIPAMVRAGRGDVVNVASVSGKRPLPRRTPYCASKTAVIGLTTTLAHEVGSSGVTVNCLSPGPVRGPRMAQMFRLDAERTGQTEEEAERAFTSRAALGRLLGEDEIGQAVVAMLGMPGLQAADVDLSAGMVGR